MLSGTPYAHLRICGSPWDGNEYQPGDRGAWAMTYRLAGSLVSRCGCG